MQRLPTCNSLSALLINAGLFGLSIYQLMAAPEAGNHALALPPLIIAALIGAAATAASGIAGAAGSAAAAGNAAEQSERDRMLKEKLAKMQLAEQMRQAAESRQMSAQQGVLGTIGNQAQLQGTLAQGQTGADTDIQNTLSKAFLGRGG